MEQQKQELHIFFFPFMAQGHTLPTIDMAKMFSSCASRSVKCTILAPPRKSISIANLISTFNKVDVKIINFPVTADVPEGIESVDECTSGEMVFNFMKGLVHLQEPLERLLEEFRPDCIVADLFFPWATDAAAKFNIPRLLFYGSSIFAHCAEKCLNLYKPFVNVASDTEHFVLPTLPHEIKLTRAQIPRNVREQHEFSKNHLASLESDLNCHGTIFNSFYDLEADYFNHYTNKWKKNIWCVGPLSLQSNKDTATKIVRGKKAVIDENECLKWLDSQKPDSVIYICFGSETYLSYSQLYQIAMGIEASQQPFIWVVRRKNKDNEEEKGNENDKYWMPEGFEERMKDRGLIIRGWAPQVLILNHDSVGGFVTHCGWNSTMEGICGGVAMVTWPSSADQFYNEKLVTEVLKIGVSVGVKEYKEGHNVKNEGIMSEVIEKAVKTIFMTKEGEEMRRRAKELKKKAEMAGEDGGSSYNDMNALFNELCSLKVAG